MSNLCCLNQARMTLPSVVCEEVLRWRNMSALSLHPPGSRTWADIQPFRRTALRAVSLSLFGNLPRERACHGGCIVMAVLPPTLSRWRHGVSHLNQPMGWPLGVRGPNKSSSSGLIRIWASPCVDPLLQQCRQSRPVKADMLAPGGAELVRQPQSRFHAFALYKTAMETASCVVLCMQGATSTGWWRCQT
jgi:hypothetical protein